MLFLGKIISELYFPNRGVVDHEAINASGEPILPLSTWIMTENPNVKDHDMSQFFDVVIKRDEYRAEYLRHWNATATDMAEDAVGKRTGSGEVDVILCPAGPGVAPKHGTSKYWGYTSQWNLLNCPALVFPVSRVDLIKDGKEKNFKPMSIQDQENHGLYTGPEDFEGAPVGLQLVGREGYDEKVRGKLPTWVIHASCRLFLEILESLSGATNLLAGCRDRETNQAGYRSTI